MPRLRARARAQTDQPLADLPLPELLARLQQVQQEAQTFGYRFQLANLGGVWTDYLTQTLERARPDQAQALSAGLMAGSRAVESAEQGYRLYEVAIAATQDPDARRCLAEQAPDSRGWRRLPDHSSFRQALTAFLTEFGHRGVYEFELANPRWNENPAYLLECIGVLLAQEKLAVPYELAREKRQAAEAEVARLPLRLRPFVFWLARQARQAGAAREAGKSTLIALLEPLRAIAREIGRRMAADGLLQEQEDVFFLTWPDLIAFLRGEWAGQGAAVLAADRKEQRDAWFTSTPADVFICDAEGRPAALPETFGKEIAVSEERPDTASNHSDALLRGIAASPGQVSGRARIIRHPDEGRRLQAGEILVAPSTDPGWTPLFLRASAVVMETGGYLSHGAIVAREFGLPAVINIPGLLERVEDGAWLTVDGSRGRVTLGSDARTL